MPGNADLDVSTHPRSSTWFLPCSIAADSTLNPIRAIVDKIVLPKNHRNKLIPLSIGDPTVFGNLDIPDNLVSTLITNLQSKQYNGYGPSTGALAARQAIATRYSYPSVYSPCSADLSLPTTSITPADVIICSGCSGALVIAIEALVNPGENLLVPRPGFPLYRTIAGRNNIQCHMYDLLSDRQWEADLAQMRTLIDDNTRAILVNNPGNPTGSNWSKQHILDIIALAEQYHLPIIADEVYADMVFQGQMFYPFAALSVRTPVISVGGIAKQYVCPGWRLGWLLIYDKGAPLTQLRDGMNNLSQLIIGSNTLVQSCLPNLLLNTPADYRTQLMQSLQTSASFLYQHINAIPGLQCIQPQGAMYVMIYVDNTVLDVRDGTEFSQLLLSEENVFVLPGSCFQAPQFVRLVVCAPAEPVLRTAVERMNDFCKRHRRKQNGTIQEKGEGQEVLRHSLSNGV